MRILWASFLWISLLSVGVDAAPIPSLRLEPLPSDQVSFLAGSREMTRWQSDPRDPRPFFFPFNGPSGTSLTRIGHPGDPSHGHHRSIWFAHNDVEGFNFWADGKDTQIREKTWLCYQDGAEESAMAVTLGWFAPDGKELMEQDLIVALRPLEQGEFTLELQSEFRPAAGLAEVKLGKTNFGFLAVRVAKSISEHFGGGLLTNSAGHVHEKDIFGQPAEWMDYSGPVPPTGQAEGITYFDHPSNLRYPSKWHVREDGWMGASFCMEEGMKILSTQPLRLRYLLHAHAGPLDPVHARKIQADFANRPPLETVKHVGNHARWDIRRALVDAASPKSAP